MANGEEWRLAVARTALFTVSILTVSFGLTKQSVAQVGWSAMQQSAQCELRYTADTRSRYAVALINQACGDLSQGARPINAKGRDYDYCLLQHLSGAQGDAAAAQIASACRTAFPLF